MSDNKISRRDILKIGTTGALGLAGSFYLNKVAGLPNVVHVDNHSSHTKSH